MQRVSRKNEIAKIQFTKIFMRIKAIACSLMNRTLFSNSRWLKMKRVLRIVKKNRRIKVILPFHNKLALIMKINVISSSYIINYILILWSIFLSVGYFSSYFYNTKKKLSINGMRFHDTIKKRMNRYL